MSRAAAAAKFKVGDLVVKGWHPEYATQVVTVSLQIAPKTGPLEPDTWDWHYQMRHRNLPASVSPAWIPERVLVPAGNTAREPWHRIGIY